MNTKRQTIWLVSMLSIMVVLSAYYLFTTEAPEDFAGANVDPHEHHDHQHHDHDHTMEHNEIDLNDYDLSDGEVLYLDNLDHILQEVQGQQQATSTMFDSLHLEREEQFKEEMERLLTVSASGNIDVAADAQEQIFAINDKWSKLDHLEDLIRKDFPNAIITESNNMWKVLVNTDEMQKSQAVSIMAMVMKELDAGPNEVIVEIKP